MTWILVIILPMLAALALPWVVARPRVLGAWLTLATMPALVAAWLAPEPVYVPWMLLGVDLGVDGTRRVLLVLAAVLWACAGAFAGGYMRGQPRLIGYSLCFLGAMSGNFGLIIAGDAATFYTCFALMTFASYGLVIHSREAVAVRAGRVYLVMAILGELFLISALYLAVQAAGDMRLDRLAPALAEAPYGQLIFIIGLIGFGVKIGAIPLYFWLPLAHPVAPAPASAVLSGCMIKAGLIGWMHLAPAGMVEWSTLATVVIALGMTAAIGAVVIGLCQTDPKTNLAYSSISQMGLITTMMGIGLHGGIPHAWLMPALALYALNHGLAKGLLFLGTALPTVLTGKWRIAMWAGLGFGVLAIAGGPLTAGAFTKYLLKTFAPEAPAPWPSLLPVLFIISAIATTLLLSRFLFLLSRKSPSAPGTATPWTMLAPWLVLLGFGATWLWALPGLVHRGLLEEITKGASLSAFQISTGVVWGALWPIVAGAVVFLVLGVKLRLPFFVQASRPLVPPGDFLAPILAVGRAIVAMVVAAIARLRVLPMPKVNLENNIYQLLETENTRKTTRDIDDWMRNLPVAGAGFALLFLIFILLIR